VNFGTQLHDTEWNPAPLDPPPLDPEFSNEALGKYSCHFPAPLAIFLFLRSRDLILQTTLCPMARVPMNSMGRVQRAGEERPSNSFAE
jgi:hypothetical protein